MRYFKLSVSLFVAMLVVLQVAQAQSPGIMPMEKSVYGLEEYRKDFKTGYSVSVGHTEIFGQVFRPIADSALFEGYPGVELTLDGGADFTKQVTTDANGLFIFESIPVGSFTIYSKDDDTGAFGSVSILLSKEFGSVSTMSDSSTKFDVANLKLLFTDKGLFILGQDQGTALVKPLDEVEVATEMCAAGGVAAGFGGDMGMFGAALGAAGLATGIAALASSGGHHGGFSGGGHGYNDRDHHWHRKPVSRGTDVRPKGPGNGPNGPGNGPNGPRG